MSQPFITTKEPRRAVVALVHRAINRTRRQPRTAAAPGSLSAEAEARGARDLEASALTSPVPAPTALETSVASEQSQLLHAALESLLQRAHEERGKDRRNVRLDVVEGWLKEEAAKAGVTL